MYGGTFEIKNEYCSIKAAERIVFMVLGAVKTMRLSVKKTYSVFYVEIKTIVQLKKKGKKNIVLSRKKYYPCI